MSDNNQTVCASLRKSKVSKGRKKRRIFYVIHKNMYICRKMYTYGQERIAQHYTWKI